MSDFAFSGDTELQLMHLAVRYNTQLYRWVARHVKPGQRILDFGAGNGRYCNRLTHANVFAVEADRSYHTHIHCPAYQSIDQAPRDLDLIYAINVLEHIADDRALVRQFHDHLRPGGRVLIFVPAFPFLFSRMDQRVGHYRRYRRRSLTHLFAPEGFAIQHCHYYDFVGFFASLAYKPIGDGSFSATSLVLYDRLIFPVSRLLDRLTFGRVTGKNLVLDATRQP
jgi:SAM-dependent methyltransferase